MNTLLIISVLTLNVSPADHDAIAALALAKAARERSKPVLVQSAYDKILARVLAGETVTFKVPLQLAKFDGYTDGEFKCRLKDGVPVYERLAPSTVPPGSHAHYDLNGNVIIHDNSNWGLPHTGLDTRRIAEGGQAIPKPKAKRVILNGKYYDQYPDGTIVECTVCNQAR